MLQPETVRRLAFIRYLYDLALEQSRQPEPLNAAAVLSFHDSVELFLHLACLHKDVKTQKNIPFENYWTTWADAGKKELTRAAEMSDLHEARNGLKHQGRPPASTHIEEYRFTVARFFTENCEPVFGVDFDSISMIDLVVYPKTRKYLEDAEASLAKEDLQNAIMLVSAAYSQLVAEHNETLPRSRPIRDFLSIERPEDVLDEHHESSHEILEQVAFGLNYRKYLKFKSIVPQAWVTPGITGCTMRAPERTPSVEQYTWCRNFVIEHALKLQSPSLL